MTTAPTPYSRLTIRAVISLKRLRARISPRKTLSSVTGSMMSRSTAQPELSVASSGISSNTLTTMSVEIVFSEIGLRQRDRLRRAGMTAMLSADICVCLVMGYSE